jgi:hypothetical protein
MRGRPFQDAGDPAQHKDHRIVQWSVGYVAVAYAIQHGVTLTSEAFDSPHAVVRVSMTPNVSVTSLPSQPENVLERFARRPVHILSICPSIRESQ